MSHSSHGRMPRPINFLFENSLFLIGGTLAALFWANADYETYDNFIEYSLVGGAHHDEDLGHDNSSYDGGVEYIGDGEGQHKEEPLDNGELPDANDQHSSADPSHTQADDHNSDHAESSFLGDIYHRVVERPDEDGHNHGITLHFLVTDILMALFFATAAGEVWESMLPGGSLSNPKKAATPLLATVGGIAGPALLYLALAAILGETANYGRGWAIPCATDIAFTYMVARFIFGPTHPAIAFLLLLAIADDAAGLVILAIFYPSKTIEPTWFLLTIGSIAMCWCFTKLKIHSFWPYLLIPGTLCWISFDLAGIHPALGLVPIVPFLPHAHTDLGIYAREELQRDDTLNALMHWWKNPIEIVLGLFGLTNAGVVFNSFGPGTYLVLFGLLVGKPVGICLFTWLAKSTFRLEIPSGMTMRHITLIGIISSIGFTVALFVSTAAFGNSSQEIQDGAKMGALLSFAGAPLAFLAAKFLKISSKNDEPAVE